MNTNDLIPVRRLSERGYPGKTSTHYKEIKAGRLRAVKLGSKTFVAPKDADVWVASLPKMHTSAGNAAVDNAVESIRRLALAIDKGEIDREIVRSRVSPAASPIRDLLGAA